MATTSKSVPSKSLSNGAFSFDSDGFNVSGITRIGAPSLYEMLFPDEISAHLTFYDIEFDPEDTVAELTELLADNVKHGRCNKLPSRVRAIASELEQFFKAANPEYHKVQTKIDKPPQKIEPQRSVSLRFEDEYKQTFEKFTLPVNLANYDHNLFLAKLALQQAADIIPGLKTSSGGEGEFRILVIGWNRAAIYDETERMSADQARLRDGMSPDWQERLRKHYSLIKMLPVLSKQRRFAIESAQGTYAVECRGVMDNYYASDHDDSSLRITYSKTDGWVGIFEIGVIYGIMRLDTDRKALLARCKATEKNESREDDHTGMDIPLKELETTEEEDEASEEGDLFSDLSEDEEGDGAVASSFEFPAMVHRKRKSAPTKASKTTAKRYKPSTSISSNRLYFKWRGREHGEGDVAYDGRKNNAGVLQFTDSNCTKFEGTISNDLIGKNVRFQGFKISNDGGAVTRTYREYSERAGNIFID